MSLKHLLALAGLVAVAACQSPTEKMATASPTLLRRSLQAEGAKLTERLNLLESRRSALIEASANLGILAGPVRRWVSHVGPYDEQLHQQRVDNLVLVARLRRMTGAVDVEQFVMRQDAIRAEGAKLTARINLVESRRRALIEASANLGFLAGPVRGYLSHVGPYEEQLHQQRVNNLVSLAWLRRTTGAEDFRRMTEAEDVEQFVTRQDAMRAEGAKLTARINLMESRRTALITASANLGFLAGPVKRFLSNVGPYEEQLHQERVDNLVLIARLRRMSGAADVEQFVRRQGATRGETALADRLRRLFSRS